MGLQMLSVINFHLLNLWRRLETAPGLSSEVVNALGLLATVGIAHEFAARWENNLDGGSRAWTEILGETNFDIFWKRFGHTFWGGNRTLTQIFLPLALGYSEDF